ncbi:MAG TPA: hypothetical protein VFY93_10305 [Planctomycetota bacterium]|nr:hypothetical protein [Planctomycetota bacterium]
MRCIAPGALLLFLLGLAALAGDEMGGGTGEGSSRPKKANPGCINCHDGIEEMHPWEALSCTDCHGGDGNSMEKDRAHVRSTRPSPNDETTLPLQYDLAYRRFVNPSDLRVAKEACGRCHADACANTEKSLHGTTAGHLSDGLYENGVTRSKDVRYGIFPVADDDGKVPDKGLRSLPPIPLPSISNSGGIGEQFSDLPRKSCMQCHLYSRGVGLRGRLGQDGWYRSEGCGACHIVYAHDGLSKSGDPTVDKLEPGHPLRHQMTDRIPSEVCGRCHALDASIGMSFRGLAQLPPGVPGGPDVPGTTKQLDKGRFFLDDPTVCPADVHYARGMHCIDCHRSGDVMGDGNVYGFMEHAVAIRCETCHGTFRAKATFTTERGEKLGHLRWAGDVAVLTERVTGKELVVKQVVDVLDPRHPSYNARAAKAMDPVLHGRLACYACHSAWSVNFFGFHFDRNEQFTQLDILAGKRTPGRVTTQEKIFSTFRNYYLGVDSHGRIAPYMVGFSTAGTFRDAEGKTVLREELPVTSAGLSGMTLIHHQTHTVQPAARRCDECHGAPAVLGMGSEDFRLFRDLFVVAGEAGLTVCGFDVKTPAQSVAVANLPLPSQPRDVALWNNPLTGRAEAAYVACRDGTVQIVDVTSPQDPRRRGQIDAGDARKVIVRESYLLVAAGKEGLLVYALDGPFKAKLVGKAKTTEARAVHLDGLCAYVADGPGGLRIIDLTVPEKPAVVTAVDLNGDDARPLSANDVLVHFSAARPDVASRGRTQARNVAFVADGEAGLYVVDVTHPARAKPIFPGIRGSLSGTALAFASNYDIGSAGGDIPSGEHEYLYVVGTQNASSNGVLWKLDVDVPETPQLVGSRGTVDDPRAVRIASVFQAPFLKQFAIVAGRGRGNVEIVDVTARVAQLPQAGLVDAAGRATGVDVESFPLDRLVGFDGKPLKDVSHPGARLLSRPEIERILHAEMR